MSIQDTSALATWLSGHVPGAGPPLTLRQFVGGQSNPTYALETCGARYVLRKKPAGPLLPSAHQIEREYQILRALEGTKVPVPRAIALCEDPAVVGTPFFIMEYLDGRVFSDPALPGVPPDERTAMYESAITALADLHCVDYHPLGLDDFGRAQGYLARQVARWTKQYRASQTEVLENMEHLIGWLPENLPNDDEAAIAHGDYRIGNLLFAPDEPRVIGILDWELSTIGHPLLDLAYALSTHEMPLDAVRKTGGSAVLAEVAGIPDAARLVSMYSRRARRSEPAELRFFVALAFFRSAAIMQGIAHRIALGNATGGSAALLRAAVVPELAGLGWNRARGAAG